MGINARTTQIVPTEIAARVARFSGGFVEIHFAAGS
jgi:hypothetical protein